MSTDNQTMDTKVETVNIDIDDIFGADAGSVTLPEESDVKPNIFSQKIVSQSRSMVFIYHLFCQVSRHIYFYFP